MPRSGWARGDDGYIIDDLSTGAFENIQHIKGHAHFTYHIDTIINDRLLAELVDVCDIIYHLAAAVGVRLIVESPVRTIETNIHSTEIVLSLAAKKRKRVLIASTSEVYGKRDRIPFREDDNLIMGPTRSVLPPLSHFRDNIYLAQLVRQNLWLFLSVWPQLHVCCWITVRRTNREF